MGWLPCIYADQPFEAVNPINRRNAWWAREDSNLQPSGYEPLALTIELRARAVAPAKSHTFIMAAELNALTEISAEPEPFRC